MRYTFLLLVFISLLITACNQEVADKKDHVENNPSTTTKTVPSTNQEAILYPSLTQAKMTELWDNCTFVDYTFYNLPLSLSLDNPGAIKNSLQHISTQTVPASKKVCKPAGRIFYQKNGEDLLEADIYLSKDCQFYVFYENKKPSYANMMSEQGINFFKTTLNRVNIQSNGQ